jgi:PAS domain-containing protein
MRDGIRMRCWLTLALVMCSKIGPKRTVCSRPLRKEGVMAQKEIEVILTRQLASYLAMPIIITDSAGTVLFYNEPAEVIVGRRFEETGELSADEWAQTLVVTDEQGTP